MVKDMANIRNINTADDYNELINTKGSIICIKFSASWCGPCRVLTDTIKNIDTEKVEDVIFAEVNIENEEFDNLCAELGIRGIPVLAYYKDGELKDKTTGLQSADTIISKVESLR